MSDLLDVVEQQAQILKVVRVEEALGLQQLLEFHLYQPRFRCGFELVVAIRVGEVVRRCVVECSEGLIT